MRDKFGVNSAARTDFGILAVMTPDDSAAADPAPQLSSETPTANAEGSPVQPAPQDAATPSPLDNLTVTTEPAAPSTEANRLSAGDSFSTPIPVTGGYRSKGTPSVHSSGKLRLSLILFGLTCLTTFWAGASGNDFLALLTDPFEVVHTALENAGHGLLYMGAVMAILLAHEMGHFLQAVRYGVPTSWPLFIPMPLTPLGTMGAVIVLRGSQANRRELFDIGLTGPWAGLVLALPMALIGIRCAEVLPRGGDGMGGYFGDPLIFKLLAAWLRPDVASSSQLVGHSNPLVMASWVGMLVTGLNMLPIGQLDGGHVSYALLGSRSRWIARSMVAAALAFIIYAEQYGWSLMLALVIFLGTSHPPTADDEAPLGSLRSAIGWFSLAIPIFCLTPFPYVPG